MPNDPFTAGLETFSQVATLPWRLFARPAGDAFREGLRRRNLLLDTLFYDVGVVTREEADDLVASKAAEGTILIVPPSGRGALVVCDGLDAFLAAGGGAVTTLTVAGVGSSALGTAAFARNVADAVGHPVAAVVSGYGLADLADETSGGFRWFAGLAALHHDLWAPFDRMLAAADPGLVAGLPVHADRDTAVVGALLADDRVAFDLIVAHSKGNMVVCDALHALQRTDRVRSERIGATVHVVSISSRLRMPRSCRQVTEIVGRWDMIGDFAMRRDAPPDVVVPDAWHHTNTELYGHLPVTRVLKEVLEADAAPMPPSAAG